MTSPDHPDHEQQVSDQEYYIPKFVELATGRDPSGDHIPGIVIHGQGQTVFLSVRQAECLAIWWLSRGVKSALGDPK